MLKANNCRALKSCSVAFSTNYFACIYNTELWCISSNRRAQYLRWYGIRLETEGLLQCSWVVNSGQCDYYSMPPFGTMLAKFVDENRSSTLLTFNLISLSKCLSVSSEVICGRSPKIHVSKHFWVNECLKPFGGTVTLISTSGLRY